ncbi:uncharacterized protein AB675_285 [Cyphellophora attinorum]|uniref:F-box domain-containing protein n=1 Tax=Cyphellophora attinorum TaxID=1664694 RepID=A0A0N1HB88_9EURO|nr:uncharacterized protein AB675_285 [Phialophora attinorum]KPI45406.1 hypothetical protein AB675_285 [Phialophora attinorum]
MPAVKRKHLTIGEDEFRAPKMRCSSRLNSESVDGPARASLLDLPAEILLDIFYLVREPCMIHACQRLYNLLPDFVGYSKMLLGLAFATRTGSNHLGFYYDDEPNPLVDLHTELWPLPGRKKHHDWDYDEREELQDTVAVGKWIRPSHLRALHGFLFDILVTNQVIVNADYRLTNEQRVTLDALVSEHRGPDPDLKLRMQVELRHNGGWHRAMLTLRDNFMHVRIHDKTRTQKFYQLYSINFIPDCLLWEERPIEEVSDLRDLYIRCCTIMPEDGFCRLMRGPDADNMYCHLRCDEGLLEKRILRALERPQPIHRSIPNEIESDVERFYNWLLLNYACGNPVTITYDMLNTCVENKLAGCLGHLLGNYFTMTTTNDWKWRDNWRSDREPQQNVTERRRKTSVTEEDLVKLRDKADELWWDRDCVRLIEAELSHIEDMKTMARTEGFVSWQAAEFSYYKEREQGALMERLHYDSDEDASLADELSSQRSDFSDDEDELDWDHDESDDVAQSSTQAGPTGEI